MSTNANTEHTHKAAFMRHLICKVAYVSDRVVIVRALLSEAERVFDVEILNIRLLKFYALTSCCGV